MPLSVAMIAKNEVETLERTIQSVRDYVDEVVVGLDEASSDGTRELAARIADKVAPIHLTEELAKKGPRDSTSTDWGFSRARNIVLAACKATNWHLTLDGHELVHKPEGLAQAIAKAEAIGVDGIECNLHFEIDARGIPSLLYKQGRVFKPNVRYSSPIHNVPVVSRYYTADEFYIEHCKKHQSVEARVERDQQRSDSTINGLRKQAIQYPKDPRKLFYLAQSLKENARYSEAAAVYQDYLEISTWKEERWHARVNLGACLSAMGKEDQARLQYSLAVEEFPAMVEAYYYAAHSAYNRKCFHEAVLWLEECLKMDIPNCKLFVTPKVYMYDRYDLLAMAYGHLGEYDKAIATAQKILERNADDARVLKNIECWKQAKVQHA